ncbi:MAG: prepilin-type N-terminal cleavage/methylation domain-containing protein [Candidatus Delongbacteria bacterium]|jgi:prepilin-type N-terminal cleavage/methylation domain-containing protein|nr:prepilin-type N-terminal cleavage/methylation domain-containing protein [Candidatus Delongbacteria bacterium]
MKKGFTLIEVLVTALILVISLTGILMSFVTAKKIIRNGIHRANAAEIIDERFEGIQRRTTVADLESFLANKVPNDTDTYGGFTADQVSRNLSISGGNESNWTYFVEYQITPLTDSDLFQVVARVSWDVTYSNTDSPNSMYMAMYTNNPDQ